MHQSNPLTDLYLSTRMFKTIISESVYQQIINSQEEQANNASLCKILHLYGKELLSSEATQELKNNPAKCLDNPSALYILDITPTEALGIQHSYGVMCLSGEHPDVSPLIDINDYFSPVAKEKKINGWDKILNNVKTLPSNALLIKDRYLFSNKNTDYGDGLINIRKILRELLPVRFKGKEYHITIVFDVAEMHEKFHFAKIAADLNDMAHQIRKGYEFMVEIFGINYSCPLYHETHDRQIISNYYFVEASRQLAAFTPNDLGVMHQSITPWALFTESSLNGDSTAPIDSIEETFKIFRTFYRSLSRESTHDTYFYALNGERKKHCTAIRNRLLK